jgi:hypothetical protein
LICLYELVIARYDRPGSRKILDPLLRARAHCNSAYQWHLRWDSLSTLCFFAFSLSRSRNWSNLVSTQYLEMPKVMCSDSSPKIPNRLTPVVGKVSEDVVDLSVLPQLVQLPTPTSPGPHYYILESCVWRRRHINFSGHVAIDGWAQVTGSPSWTGWKLLKPLQRTGAQQLGSVLF